MYRMLAPVMLTMLAVAMVGGCETTNGQADRGPLPLADPVPILDKHAGSQCCVEQPVLRLITNQQQLEDLGCAHFEEWEVDLTQNDMIVATLGTQPTGGFAIDISAIQIVGDTLYVQGKTTVPGEDEMVTQALTQPYCVVIVPKTGATQLRSDID